MKPLYIVGTQRDIGKTTMSLGLLHALRQRGMKVAYIKPLGQRITSRSGHTLHDDARLVATILGLQTTDLAEMAVPLPSGVVEKEVKDLDTPKLLDKVLTMYRKAAEGQDLVICEAMGHVAAGACLGLSAADVARELDARALMVSGGGIGRALDEIALCATFMSARGAAVTGIIVNQVWPEKYDRVKEATTAGLCNMGMRTFGTVPYQPALSSPAMLQVHHLVGGKLLGGQEHLGRRVRKKLVAAMESGNMVRHIEPGSLVIMPGDRIDNILTVFGAQILGEGGEPTVAGMILTGGFEPTGTAMSLIRDSRLPVILVEDDTYTLAGQLRQAVFKIPPEDGERIQLAVKLVEQYVDVEGILRILND